MKSQKITRAISIAALLLLAAIIYRQINGLNLRGNSRLIIPLAPGMVSKLSFVVPEGGYTIASVLEQPEGTGSFARSKVIPGIHLKVSQGAETKFEGPLERMLQVHAGGFGKGAVTLDVSCEATPETPPAFYVILGRPL